MLIRFFISLVTFCLLWFFLDANPHDRAHEDWVFRGMEQGVGSLETIVHELQKGSYTGPDEMNDFVNRTLKKDAITRELSAVLADYFLTKKLKSQEPGLEKKLVLLHDMLRLLGRIKLKNEIQLVERLGQKLREFRRMVQMSSQSPRVPRRKVPYKAPRKRREFQHQFSFLPKAASKKL